MRGALVQMQIFKFGCFGGGSVNVSGNVSSCVEPVPGEKE